MANRSCAWLSAAIGLLMTPCAFAQSYFAEKQMTIVVGSGVGGGYDIYARLVGRHWPKFIPGSPTFVIQNLPAAGSLVAMNMIANSAPKDGTHIGAVQNHIGVEPIMGITGSPENARYDSRKLNWIGSAAKEVAVVIAWHNSGFKTFKDLQDRPMLVGSPGVATSSSVYANLLNELAGTKFKVITGYNTPAAIDLALERNEVQGRTGWYVSSMLSAKKQWLDEGKIDVLLQLAVEKHAAFPKVPLVTEFISDPVKRAQLDFAFSWQLMGRPFVVPAEVPQDRVKLLRESFMTMMADSGVQAEATKLGLEVSPMSGEDVQALIARIYDTPAETVQRIRAIIVPK
ncbi:MAG: tripartite tricarboxylate transporter substrate-binding protein [Beijerinckiaceae bacterium]|nr:tripartite tricarboxylate transporter substrate-binding protein [Beijerinckiaceae bacterium]